MDPRLEQYKCIMAFTGHRPDKLGNEYGSQAMSGPVSRAVWDIFRDQFEEFGVDATISGLALGTDMLGLDASLSSDIDAYAAIPFKGQDRLWPTKSRERYNSLIQCVSGIYVVDIGKWVTLDEFKELKPTAFTGNKMQKRNRWMVTNSHILSGIYDGSTGGTANCINFATGWQKQRPNYRIIINKPPIKA